MPRDAQSNCLISFYRKSLGQETDKREVSLSFLWIVRNINLLKMLTYNCDANKYYAIMYFIKSSQYLFSEKFNVNNTKLKYILFHDYITQIYSDVLHIHKMLY